jgi:twitching motility two-component system response regulator PilH
VALILIVDDSPTEVHVMKKALEKGGFTTATAGDGQEGVRMAREMHPDHRDAGHERLPGHACHRERP